MQDFEMSLDKNESAKIRAWLGEIPSTSVSVFLWAESSDIMSVSINVEGKERFVVKISDRGNRIKIEKDV